MYNNRYACFHNNKNELLIIFEYKKNPKNFVNNIDLCYDLNSYNSFKALFIMIIKELEVNKQISNGIYQVRSASYREGDNTNGYYLMRIGDKTGQIDAIWLNVANQQLKVGDFLQVSGRVQNYQGRLQIKISSASKLDPQGIDTSEYSLFAVNEELLKKQLVDHIESIKIEPLYRVIKSLILDELFDEYCKAPAATFNHHAYMGGLLEHSVSVANICANYVNIYRDVKKDILIAGALIHDIGKIYELKFEESISYSTEGNLLGHIFIGASKFQRACEKIDDFPAYLSNNLLHIILSHHGMIERGSPVEPRTLEAILVHKADTTDAEANSFLISEGESAGDNWAISRTLNRIIYLEAPPDLKMR